MNTTLRNSLIISSTLIGLVACSAAEDVKNAADSTDALSSDPQTSYCEAVCDWAVDCSGESDALESCLEATRAVDANCGAAESGELNMASGQLVEDCVATVDADNCDGLTGSIDAQGTATPSTECITSEGVAATDAYNEARTSVQPSGEAFCEDLGAQICSHVVDCLVGQNSELVSDTLQDLCVNGPIAGVITSCQAVDLEVGYGTDSNANRFAANVCSNTMSGLENSCDVFTTEAWPPECTGSVIEASALVELATNLATFASEQGVELE